MPAFTHRTADFHGVSPPLLRDSPLLGGLLVAAAGAAGLSTVAAPTMRTRGDGGVTGVLLLDAEGGHAIVHGYPDREMLMLDILTSETRDAEKAIDVFARRLGARDVRRNRANRG